MCSTGSQKSQKPQLIGRTLHPSWSNPQFLFDDSKTALVGVALTVHVLRTNSQQMRPRRQPSRKLTSPKVTGDCRFRKLRLGWRLLGLLSFPKGLKKRVGLGDLLALRPIDSVQ